MIKGEIKHTHIHHIHGNFNGLLLNWAKTIEKIANLTLLTIPLDTLKYTADVQCPCPPASMSTDGSMYDGGPVASECL